MNLESQVVSLELAKQLKELGVKQESLFYWTENGLKVVGFGQIDFDKDYIRLGTPSGAWQTKSFNDEYSEDVKWFVSAFTVAELGESLPPHFHTVMSFKRWRVEHEADDFGVKLTNHVSYADTEADARAKMLIHLIENKILDAKTI